MVPILSLEQFEQDWQGHDLYLVLTRDAGREVWAVSLDGRSGRGTIVRVRPYKRDEKTAEGWRPVADESLLRRKPSQSDIVTATEQESPTFSV